MTEHKLAYENVPKDKEDGVMECTLEVERTVGDESQRVSFSGFATSEVVKTFLDIARMVIDGSERTCTQEERGWSTEGDHARVWLTCGHDCMVPTVQYLPNYCPDCGARVLGANDDGRR